MSEPLPCQYDPKTVIELTNLHKKEALNLDLGLQRKSVWSRGDRRTLILLQSYPVPSISLYRQEGDGRPGYNVIDGNQRAQPIFMSPGVWRSHLDVRAEATSPAAPIVRIPALGAAHGSPSPVSRPLLTNDLSALRVRPQATTPRG